VGIRLHITLDDDVVRELDARVGPRRRSAFIVAALREALAEEWRTEQLEQAIGSIPDEGHEWDDDPAAWIRAQRRGDSRRVG
jgi:Arc/MetJ family transcription regulator